MIRFLLVGSRRDGELAAERFGIHHVGFEAPGPDEGQIGSQVAGMCEDRYLEQVEEWFNSDPPEGLRPGSMLWFRNAPDPIVRPKGITGLA